ncbi:MAG TPA: fibronectin type III domain-containing protein, partial [Gemmataceae bacterium]|nr:fibronectin type III domain-containing protein [Gemmataceae bacterium]
FLVSAANAYGTKFGFSPAVTTPKAQAAPAAPRHFLAAALSTSQVILSWAASAGATGYSVRVLVNGKWSVLANLGAGATLYIAQGLTAGTTYSFDVGASNAGGVNYSSTLMVMTPLVSPHPLTLPDPFGPPIMIDLANVAM